MNRIGDYDDEDSNSESCLSRADPKDAFDPLYRGYLFSEVNSVQASGRKVTRCQFSLDEKLLASGGHDQKVVLWHFDTLKPYNVLEGHSLLVTDVFTSQLSSHVATFSFQKTVRGLGCS